MFKDIKKLIDIYRTKNSHFLYVNYQFYKKWKLIITFIMSLNKNYVSCDIYRKKYKSLTNIVIIGLRYSGKNVNRRAVGYAKKFVNNNRNAKCIYCEKKLTIENATTDHIIPISLGGNNTQVNLIVCCKKCNSERGNTKFMDFLKKKRTDLKSISYIFI